jgi:hypothetical protein
VAIWAVDADLRSAILVGQKKALNLYFYVYRKNPLKIGMLLKKEFTIIILKLVYEHI